MLWRREKSCLTRDSNPGLVVGALEDIIQNLYVNQTATAVGFTV
jgi:hypothetical protein